MSCFNGEKTSQSDLNQAIENLFTPVANKTYSKLKCAKCLRPLIPNQTISPQEQLSPEVVRVIVQSLTFENTNSLKLDSQNERIPFFCHECTNLLSSLGDLFFQIEKLMAQFNELRRKLGKEIILTSLKRSRSDWRNWSRRLTEVERFYPTTSFVGDSLNEIKIEFSDNNMDEQEDGPSFNMETAVKLEQPFDEENDEQVNLNYYLLIPMINLNTPGVLIS